MDLKIINEPTEICCDNYNKDNNTIYDDSICIDCDDTCRIDGYLVKFVINNKIIHQYERHKMLNNKDAREIQKLIEKLSNKKKVKD
jgi:hypothetical protein